MSNSKKLFPLKDLNAHDVLLGRGTGPNEHIGNVRYRALVRDIIEDTDMVAWNSTTKRDLAVRIVAAVKAKGGRFVRKATTLGPTAGPSTSKKTIGEMYEEVPDSLAYAKTKQSFRHQLKLIEPPSPAKAKEASSATAVPASKESERMIKTCNTLLPSSALGATTTPTPFIPSGLSLFSLANGSSSKDAIASHKLTQSQLIGLGGLMDPELASGPLTLRGITSSPSAILGNILAQRERMLLLSKLSESSSASLLRSSTLPSLLGANSPSGNNLNLPPLGGGAYGGGIGGGTTRNTTLLLDAAIWEVLRANQQSGGHLNEP